MIGQWESVGSVHNSDNLGLSAFLQVPVMLTDIDALKLVVAQEVPFVNFLIKLNIVIAEKVFQANFCYKLNKYLNHITFILFKFINIS